MLKLLLLCLKMDVQKTEEFQTTKFFCKTDMDMKAIQAEEADYVNYPIPKFYHFKSRDARERILYANFNQVERDAKNMVAAIFNTIFVLSQAIKYKVLRENASLNGTSSFVSCLEFIHVLANSVSVQLLMLALPLVHTCRRFLLQVCHTVSKWAFDHFFHMLI